MVKIVSFFLLLLVQCSVCLADDKSFALEGIYGFSSVAPSGLNDERSKFIWNSVGPTQGRFNDLQYLAVNVGYKFFDWGSVLLRYEASSQKLSQTSFGTYSVTDSFVYNPLYVLLDVPVYNDGSFSFNLRGGLGYALNYEFHQVESPGEELIWQAHPIVFGLGMELGYLFTDNFGIFADLFYEHASSQVKAAKDYATTINSVPISSGRALSDPTNGNTVTVDMSGIRYGIGLGLQF